MAVWDENYKRTNEADNLDYEVGLVLCPILDKAIKNGLTPEDVLCIVTQVTNEWVLDTVLSKRR